MTVEEFEDSKRMTQQEVCIMTFCFSPRHFNITVFVVIVPDMEVMSSIGEPSNVACATSTIRKR